MVFVTIKNKNFDNADIIAIDESTKLPEGITIDIDKYFNFFMIKKMEDIYNIFDIDYQKYVEIKQKKISKISRREV